MTMPAIPNCVKKPMPLNASGKAKRVAVPEQNEGPPDDCSSSSVGNQNATMSLEPNPKRQKLENGDAIEPKSVKKDGKSNMTKPKVDKKKAFASFFKMAPKKIKKSIPESKAPTVQQSSKEVEVVDVVDVTDTKKRKLDTSNHVDVISNAKEAVIKSTEKTKTIDTVSGTKTLEIEANQTNEDNSAKNAGKESKTVDNNNQSTTCIPKAQNTSKPLDTTGESNKTKKTTIPSTTPKITKYDEDLLRKDVAACIITAFSNTTDSIMNKLKEVQGGKYADISKRKATMTIQLLGEKTKKENDVKKIWYVKKDYEHILTAEQKNIFEAARTERNKVQSSKTPNKLKKSSESEEKSGCSPDIEPTDPKYLKYKSRLEEMLDAENTLVSSLQSSELSSQLSDMINHWKENRKNNEVKIAQSLDTSAEIAIIAQLTQGSNKSLLLLVKSIVEILGEEHVTPQAIEERVKLTAQRKSYGVKNVKAITNVDECKNALWTWEVDNLDLLETESAKLLVKERKRRKAVGLHLNSITKMLELMRKVARINKAISSLDKDSEALLKKQEMKSNLEGKISAEEEKVLKFIRDEETKRQKKEAKLMKEQQKLEEKQKKEEAKRKKVEEEKKKKEDKLLKTLPQKPKVTLNNFFKAPSKKDTKLSKPQGTTVVVTKNDESKIDDAIARSTLTHDEMMAQMLDSVFKAKSVYDKKVKSKIRKRMECVHSVENMDVVCVNENVGQEPKPQFGASKPVDSLDILRCKGARKKLLQFFEDVRPPYFGTFRKKPVHVKYGRRPFGTLENIDYDYDSAEEWEDVEDGESLASNEEKDMEGEEGEGNNNLDYKDGWLAADNEIDYDSGVEDPDKFSDMYNNVNVHVRNIVGVTFIGGAQAKPGEHNSQLEVLKQYRVEGLPKCPLVVPNVIDIGLELLSKQARKKLGGLKTPVKTKSPLPKNKGKGKCESSVKKNMTTPSAKSTTTKGAGQAKATKKSPIPITQLFIKNQKSNK